MIDTHAHLHLLDKPVVDVLSAAKLAGVSRVIQVAIDVESIHRNCSIYRHLDMCAIAVGIHPLSVNESLNLPDILSLLKNSEKDAVAIGEIGLDYKYGIQNKPRQHQFFKAQLDLAQAINKPVIIHMRESEDDMLDLVNAYPSLKKVFHCYSTHLDFYEALKGDFNFVSFTGKITHAKKGKSIRAMKHIPLNRIMLESDSPYCRPKGVLSGQSYPQYIGMIAAHMATHRDCPLDEIVDQTTANAKFFFNLN